MFTFPTPNLIESDEGFSVEILGQTGVQYEDKLGIVRFDGEVLAGPAGFMIYRDSIQEIENHADVVMSDARRNSIVENIRQAFAQRGFDIEIY